MGQQGFEIHLRGSLPPGAIEDFEHLAAKEVPAETVLSGVLPDQAALFGVLTRVQALGLELVEVRRVQEDPEP